MRYLIKIILIATLSLLFISIYIPLPFGIMSLISLCGLLMSLLRMNKDTMGIALLLYSGALMGTLFLILHIQISGYIVSTILGLLLVKGHIRSFTKQSSILIIIIGIFILFFISYLSGPQHAYSNEKITYILLIGSVAAFAWYINISSFEIECEKLALFLAFISCTYLSISFDYFHFWHPSSILDFDFLRASWTQLSDYYGVPYTYHSVGIYAMLAIAYFIGRQKNVKLITPINAIFFVICVGLVIISQARQAFLGLSLILLFRIILDAQLSKLKKTVLIVSIVSMAFYGLYNIKSEAFEATLTADTSSGFFNRDYKGYEAESSDRNVMFGTGLGGFSKTGERLYPHNMLLELYIETGWFGLLTLLLLISMNAYRKHLKLNRVTNSSYYILLPIIGVFVRSMASSDLTESISFIVAMVVLINIKGATKSKLITQ